MPPEPSLSDRIGTTIQAIASNSARNDQHGLAALQMLAQAQLAEVSTLASQVTSLTEQLRVHEAIPK